MTAPDVNADVRARFEAWLASQGFTSKPEQRPNGKYVNGQIQGNWLAWQAAHADLSGEVRESYTPFPQMPSGLVIDPKLGPLFDRMQMQSYAMKFLDAALAKYTQEKP